MKTTKLLILSFILISVSSNAQDLDQEFLDSLPDDLKEDLVKKMKVKKKKPKKHIDLICTHQS